MKNRFSLVAVLVAAIGGFSLAHAESSSDELRAVGLNHFTYVEWAYFSGDGFKSHPESYAEQDKVMATVSMPKFEGMPTGHTYSAPEYLYFSGKGFASD